MSIRIVVHAYAKQLPQYAVFLRAQLSSLVKYTPAVTTLRVSVCCSAQDERVMRVLQEFAPIMRGKLHVMAMPKGELFRRSIGRNRIALSTHEDLVWFADVDHLWGPGCLAELWNQWKEIEGQAIAWPKSLWIQSHHVLGDDFVRDNMETTGLIDMGDLGVAEFANQEPSPLFERKEYHSAIGGVQIVSGSFVRDHGYLRDFPKWQRPRTDGKPFGDFRDDVKFRSFCLSRMNGVALEIPHLYRLRHTAVTYKG